MKPLVTLSRQGAVLRVTLNRPERRNALDGPLAEALDAALAEALADPQARIVVLAGEGPTFCSGLDLSGQGEAFRRTPGNALSPFQSVVRRLMEATRPVVARLHGGAFGAGFGLMLCCDLAVAADDTRFVVSELRFGLPPTLIPLVLHHTGRLGAARHLLMTGAPFDTATALQCGLVHRIVPPEGLDAAVDEACRELMACAPGAFAQAREIQRRLPELSFAEGLRVVGERLEAALDGAEAREGREAWREGRPPRWTEP